jgi:hypoxanthine phosphoribosyltransferase
MLEKVRIPWAQIEEDCDRLSKRIEPCDCIVALGRGGLVPGVILSYKINCYVFNLGIQRYKTDNTPGDLQIIQSLGDDFIKKYRNKKVVVFDDLSDRGNTLMKAKEVLSLNNFNNVKFATLYTKKSTKFVPDNYIKEFNDNIWLDFPWESV